MKQEKRRKRDKHNESLTYAIEVKDKEGRVLRHISEPSRSYVEQWNQLLNVQVAQANRSVRMTSGTPYSMPPHKDNFACNAAAGETTIGIRVGKGTTPVAIDDYALETPCEEGTGTDEFNYQLVIYTFPQVVSSTCSFTLSRIMINNSGATISGIKEIGNYMGGSQFMGFRDVLPSPVSIPDGGSITVTYTLSVTV